jgi:CheY-like chemotaxis protein
VNPPDHDVSRLHGLRIFVVEDEAPVAMLIEDMLEDLGCLIAASAASISQALDCVAQGGFDFGLLDINVNGERIDPVALALQSRHVPFLFASGYGAAGLRDEWRSFPVVQKPFRSDVLRDAILAALEEG